MASDGRKENPDVRLSDAKGFAAWYSPECNIIFLHSAHEFTVEYLLSHEALHKVLYWFIGYEASRALDEIGMKLVMLNLEKPL